MENWDIRFVVILAVRNSGRNSLVVPYVGGWWRRLLKSYRPRTRNRNRSRTAHPSSPTFNLRDKGDFDFNNQYRMICFLTYLISFLWPIKHHMKIHKVTQTRLLKHVNCKDGAHGGEKGCKHLVEKNLKDEVGRSIEKAIVTVQPWGIGKLGKVQSLPVKLGLQEE